MAEDLVLELKKLIINTLKLEDIAPGDIEDDAPLFGEGLGLDSIDALELVVALEKTYNVFIPDSEVGKKVFRSVNALAGFVKTQAHSAWRTRDKCSRVSDEPPLRYKFMEYDETEIGSGSTKWILGGSFGTVTTSPGSRWGGWPS
jgi:acyl carrier protein